MTTNITDLTTDQASAAAMFDSFIENPGSGARVMVLNGGPGVGKSYLTARMIKGLPSDYEVAITAPTNKAVNVIRRMAAEAGVPDSHAATIHSLLGLRLMPSGQVRSLGQGGRNKAQEFDIIFVDEGSMISPGLMSYIDQELDTSVTKWVFIGDRYQIPPVGYGTCPAFDVDTPYSVELTKVVRQAADNPILSLLPPLREAIDTGTIPWSSIVTSRNPSTGHGVFVFDIKKPGLKDRFTRWMLAGYKTDNYEHDGDYIKTVAWRNVTVTFYNKAIRNTMYGSEARVQPVLVGEKVLCASPIQAYDEIQPYIAAPTDSEGVVRSCELGIHPIAVEKKFGEYKCYCLKIYFPGIGLIDAWRIHEDDEDAFYKKKDELAKRAKKNSREWGTFWAFNDMFCDIRPAHAITAHRSQGSTYDNVFVDVQDILRNNNTTEAMKILYVAVSRARYNAMLLV